MSQTVTLVRIIGTLARVCVNDGQSESPYGSQSAAATTRIINKMKSKDCLSAYLKFKRPLVRRLVVPRPVDPKLLG